MTAFWARASRLPERLLAELTDVAVKVGSRYGVLGSRVYYRLRIRSALGEVFREPARPETLVARATDAAYRVTLAHGFHGPFLDLELELWQRLHDALRRSPFAQALAPSLATEAPLPSAS
jgi:hypothetical protein